MDDDDDGDDDDVSRIENRSIDVLVDDDDGGTQLIAYSVFEQVTALVEVVLPTTNVLAAAVRCHG